MSFHIESFGPSNRDDFFEFHSRVGGECFCTAWWMRTWEEFLEADAVQTRAFRENLLGQGEYDGYLIYDENKVIGWCQVGQRDRLAKILEQFSLTINPRVWAITCFRIDSEYQRRGVASELLKNVLDELGKKGIEVVEAYPKIDTELAGDQQWTGPKNMYERAGFSLIKENNSRAVYSIKLRKVPLSELSHN
jgi:ribosomal protein S18 acetylase RimI-like enzyme